MTNKEKLDRIIDRAKLLGMIEETIATAKEPDIGPKGLEFLIQNRDFYTKQIEEWRDDLLATLPLGRTG
jgi:hypothetical protein